MRTRHPLPLSAPSEGTSRAVRTEQTGQDVPSGEPSARSRRGRMCLRMKEEAALNPGERHRGQCSADTTHDVVTRQALTL